MGVSILLVVVTSLITAAAQLLIKQTAPGIKLSSGIVRSLRSLLQPALLLGILLALGAPLLYYRALRGIPLSLAFSLSALSYAWVPLGAVLILKERITRRQGLGILLILSGVLLWGGL